MYRWKEEGRKRIILVDYLLQIYLCCLCRYRPPISFTTLQFFFFNLEPYVWFWILRVSFRVVNLLTCMSIFILPGMYLCLIRISVWSFKFCACGSQCPNSLISVVIFNKWEIVSVYMYTSCLSFNFLLEILVVVCLDYWKSCCYSHAFQETNSLRRTMQIVECSFLHQRAQGRVSS